MVRCGFDIPFSGYRILIPSSVLSTELLVPLALICTRFSSIFLFCPCGIPYAFFKSASSDDTTFSHVHDNHGRLRRYHTVLRQEL